MVDLKWNDKKIIPPDNEILIGYSKKSNQIFLFKGVGDGLFFVVDHYGYLLDYPKIKLPDFWAKAPEKKSKTKSALDYSPEDNVVHKNYPAGLFDAFE